MNYIQGHIRKIKSAGACAKVLNHNFRENEFSRSVIDPAKAGNVVIDKIADFSEVRGKVAGRADSVDMLDLVVSVSDDTGIPINEFHSAIKSFAQKRYGLGLVSVSTHGDERTLHSHISFVPLVMSGGKLKLSAKLVMGKKSDLSQLQSELGQLGRKWGLVRGESATVTKSKHETVASRRAKLQAFERLPDPEPVPEKVGLLDGKRVAEEYRDRAAQAIALANASRIAAIDAAAQAEKLKKEKAKQAKELLRLREENDRMKRETAKLRDLDLLSVMDALQYVPDRTEGAETIYQTGLGKLSINAAKHIFSVDWEGGKGGRGAIDLVRAVEGCGFKEACQILQNAVGVEGIRRARVAAIESHPVPPISLADEIEIRCAPMPYTNRVERYLCNDRLIDPEIVGLLVKNGVIWQNKHGAAAFEFVSSEQNGERCGCAVRGTFGSTFKQTIGRVGDGFVLNLGDTQQRDTSIIVCESPIDALSVATLIKRYGWHTTARIHGLGGCGTLPKHLNRADVISAFDSDATGDKASGLCSRLRPLAVEKLETGEFVESTREIKDWNDVLKLGADRARIIWEFATKTLLHLIHGAPAPIIIGKHTARAIGLEKTARQQQAKKKGYQP